MLSLKELYQIGHGPSSSHTMGPAKAAEIIKNKYKDIGHITVKLYNSLALTGQGHLTHDAIKHVLNPHPVDFLSEINQVKHPNNMLFSIYDKEGNLMNTEEVQSIGGGRILFIGDESNLYEPYSERSFDEIKMYCKEHKLSLYDYVVQKEGKEIVDFLYTIWEAMKEAVERGLKTEGVLPGPLKVKRKAPMLYKHQDVKEDVFTRKSRLITSYAYAVSEENASGGIIVTAPTCGACGVLPAVLYDAYMNDKIHEEIIIEGLAVAGIVGKLIKHNASISGAVAGCQAEVGSACTMAAAAYAFIKNADIDTIEHAAEIAMEHHLGLTCDPVNGYVQIPCIERNAVAALRAIDAKRLALIVGSSNIISLDTVIETMYHTGLDMNVSYKETSIGGLAKFYKGEKDANCW